MLAANNVITDPGILSTEIDGLLVLGGEDSTHRPRSRCALRIYRWRLKQAITASGRQPRQASAGPLKIILSGGRCPRASVELVSEAEQMRGFLLAQGVQNSALLLDEQARDTSGNLILGIGLARAAGLRRVALITDDFHVERCRKLYRHIFGDEGIVIFNTGESTSRWGRLREIVASGLAQFSWALAGVRRADLEAHTRFLYQCHPFYSRPRLRWRGMYWRARRYAPKARD